MIVALHVAMGAAAGAASGSRVAALLLGPVIHLAGDRLPHQDIRFPSSRADHGRVLEYEPLSAASAAPAPAAQRERRSPTVRQARGPVLLEFGSRTEELVCADLGWHDHRRVRRRRMAFGCLPF